MKPFIRKVLRVLDSFVFVFSSSGVIVSSISSIVFFVLGKYCEAFICIAGTIMFIYMYDKIGSGG